MKLRKLIKCFMWREQDRDIVVLGPSTRINPETHRAQLIATDGAYPLTANLYVKSRLTQPKSVRRWAGFEARVLHVRDSLGANITFANYRLDNGTGERWWNGSAWVAPGANDWNTEQEVADNIDVFDAIANDRKLRVVVNLGTTDKRYTPQLEWVKVLYEAHIEFQDDIILRSLVPDLRTKIRPISRVVVAMPATGTTLNISAFGLESGFNVRGIDAVFNYDANPSAAKDGSGVDLLSSFVLNTGVITLTGAVTAGVQLWIRFVYEPEVAVTTSQDYIEQERLPAIVLTDIELVNTADAPSGDDAVVNKGAGTAVYVPSPQQGDLQITLLGMTENLVDHQYLMEEVNAYFANNTILVSAGIDEGYRLHLIDEYAESGEPGQESIHLGRAIFMVRNFRRWLRNAENDSITNQVLLSIGSE